MIIRAKESDLTAVRHIVRKTIGEVYPRYYPAGAVSFFLEHHNDEVILEDLKQGLVYLLKDKDTRMGTVTIRENEICRLFVLPEHQGKGCGRQLLDFAEARIASRHPEIVLDSSLPARGIYLKRGYRDREYRQVATGNGDMLCYDVMFRRV